LLLCCATAALTLGLAAFAPGQDPSDDTLVPLILNLLGDQDKEVRSLALEQIRTQAKGATATNLFAAQLPQLAADVQTELLSALADRGDSAARSAIAALLNTTDQSSVRVAAMRALGFLGDAADVPALLHWLQDGSQAEQDMARGSLIRLPGEAVSRAILAASSQADDAQRLVLLEILAERRAFEVAPDLLPLVTSTDASVRAAAMRTLGQLAGPEHIPGMLPGVLAAERGRERDDAEKSVMLVCQRIEDPQQQAQPLLAAISALGPADQAAILPTLGRVGGPSARGFVRNAIGSHDPALKDAGVRALCNWPNASVAADLIELIQTAKEPGDQLAAMRALIRVAVLPDGRSDLEKLELLQTALSLCTRDTERKLVLQRAQAVRIPEALRFLLPFLDQPAMAQQACSSIVELAHHRALRDAHKAEFHAALERVIRDSTDETVVDRAQRYQRGQTWVRPKK
jgi:HEAT repeat protein